MADFRSHNPSNDPETCLWCGRRLRWPTIGVYEKRTYSGGHFQEHTGNVRMHEKAGDYGDGFFCGLRCAYQFGVAMAEFGHRLLSSKDKPEPLDSPSKQSA